MHALLKWAADMVGDLKIRMHMIPTDKEREISRERHADSIEPNTPLHGPRITGQPKPRIVKPRDFFRGDSPWTPVIDPPVFRADLPNSTS